MSNSYENIKNSRYCVGGRHHTSTINIKPKITYNNNTGKKVKLFEGKCSSCKRTKTRIVSDNTIQAEGLQDFFKGLGNAAKTIGKKIVNNPTRALEIGTNLATAALTKNPKAIATQAPSVIKFIHHGKGLYVGKIH